MFTIRFWLLLLLFIGSYRLQRAAESSPPNERESSVESDGEEVPFLNEGEKLTDLAPDEQLKNGVVKRGSGFRVSGIKQRPMSPERNFLLEFPARGKEQNDRDLNDKLMEAMVIMEADQMANENGENDYNASENIQNVSVRSTNRPMSSQLENTSLGIIETKKSVSPLFDLRHSLEKGDNWAMTDKEDDVADMGLADTTEEEAIEGNNNSRVGMKDEFQTPVEEMGNGFEPKYNNDAIYNFSKGAEIQSLANSESGNISADIRTPEMLVRNQRQYPNMLKNRNMMPAESDNRYSERRSTSFKRNEGNELTQDRTEITQNGENWNFRAAENSLTAKGNIDTPLGTDQSYYSQMKQNNELYGTDNVSQGYLPLGDTVQENDQPEDIRGENVEKRGSGAPFQNNMGFKDGVNPQYLVTTSIGGIKNELEDNDEVEKVFEDYANVSETGRMNVGYDDVLLGKRNFDSNRDRRLIHDRDRFQRVPDLKHADDDERSGNSKSHDSNDMTSEGPRRRPKGHKRKRPGNKSRLDYEDENEQGEEEEECCQLMRKDKCKVCDRQYKLKHGKNKGGGNVSKSKHDDDCVDKDDDDVMDECTNTNHTHRPVQKERAVALKSATVPVAQESIMVDERRSLPNGEDTSSLEQISQGNLNQNDLLDKFTNNDSVKFDFVGDSSETSDGEWDILSPKNLTLRKIGGKKSKEALKRYHDEQENRKSVLSWQFGPNVEIFNNGNTGEGIFRASNLDGNTLLQNENGDKSHFYGNSIWENGFDELNKTYPSGSYSILCKDDEDTTTEKPVSSVVITGVTNKMNRDNVTSVRITSKKLDSKKKRPSHNVIYCSSGGNVEPPKFCAFPVKKTFPPLPDYKFPPHSNTTNLISENKSKVAPSNSASISGLVEGQTRHGHLSNVTMSDEWVDGLEVNNSTNVAITGPFREKMAPPKAVTITRFPFIQERPNQSYTDGIFITDASTPTIMEKRPFIDNAFFDNGVPNCEREGKPYIMEGKSDNISKVVPETSERQRQEESKLKEEKNMSRKEGFSGSKQLNHITNDEQAKFTPISEKGAFTNNEGHGGKVEDNVKLEPQNRAPNTFFNPQPLTSSNISNVNQFGSTQLVAGQDGNRLSDIEKMKLERNNTNMVFDSNLEGRRLYNTTNKVENQALPDRNIMDNNSVFESQALNKNRMGNKNSNNMMYQTRPGNTELKGGQLYENNSDFRNQTNNANLKPANQANNVMSQLGPASSDRMVTDKNYEIKDSRIGDKSAYGMTYQIRPTNTVTQDEKFGSPNIGRNGARNGNWKTDGNANNVMHQVRPSSMEQDGKNVNFDYRSQARNGNFKTEGRAKGMIPQARPPSTMSQDEKLPGNSDFKSQTRNENWRPDQNANNITNQIRPPNTMSQGGRINTNSNFGSQTRNENWRGGENANNNIHQIRPSNTMPQGERINTNGNFGSQTRNENWRADENANNNIQIRPSNTMPQGERINTNSNFGSQTRNENWRGDENANNIHQIRPSNTMSQGERINTNSNYGSQTRNENWRGDENANNNIHQIRPSNTMPQGERINTSGNFGSQTRNENWRTDENPNNIVHQMTPANTMPQDVKMTDRNFDRNKPKNENWMPNENVNGMMQQAKPFNTFTQDGKHTNGNFDPRSQNKNGNWMAEKNVNDMMHQDGRFSDKISNFRTQVKNEKWMPSKSAKDMMYESGPSNNVSQYGKMVDGNGVFRGQSMNENWISNKNGTDTMHQTKPVNSASQDGNMKDRYSEPRMQDKNGKWMSNENANDMMQRMRPTNTGPQGEEMTERYSGQERNENRISNKNTYSMMHQTKPSNTFSQDDRMADRNYEFRFHDKNGKWISNENTKDMTHRIIPPNNQDTITDRNMNPRIQIKDGNWRPDKNTNDRIQPARLPNAMSAGDKMLGRNYDSRSQTNKENGIIAENSNTMVHQNIFQEENGTNFRSQTRNENWMANENANNRPIPHQVRPSNNPGVADNNSFTNEKVDSNSLSTNNKNLSPPFGNTHSNYEERKFLNSSQADNENHFNHDSTVNTSNITNFSPENRMEIYTETGNKSRPNNEPLQDESVSPSALGIKASFLINKGEKKSPPANVRIQNSWELPEEIVRAIKNRLTSMLAGNHSNLEEAISTDPEPSVGRLDMNIAFTGRFPANQRRLTSHGYIQKKKEGIEIVPEIGTDKVVILPLSVKYLRNNMTGRKIIIDSPSNSKQRNYIYVSAPTTEPSLVPVIKNNIPKFKNTNVQHRKFDVLPNKFSANNDTKLRILLSNPQELLQLLKEFKMKNSRLQDNKMMKSAQRARGQNHPPSNRHTIKPGEDLLHLIQSFRRALEAERLPSYEGKGEKEGYNVEDSTL